ncbi:hypothetical protein COOONC_26062 [Cooperia oncophora]
MFGGLHLPLHNCEYYCVFCICRYPDTWMSRLCVIILICVALVLLPSQIEALGQTWIARQKCGSDYSGGFAKNEKHVVVTITHLEMALVRDFLDEFYAHHENKRVHVVLLSPAELDDPTRLLLKFPLYSERVHYVRGTVLRDENLERARLGDAQACFILSARHQDKKISTDEHTILRSWAVKDFAPHVKQYVQIFRPETKMHLEHAGKQNFRSIHSLRIEFGLYSFVPLALRSATISSRLDKTSP